MNSQFQVNQIVKGKVCGEFIIIGFRNIGGEGYAQLKEHNKGQLGRGEFSLPLTAIKAKV